MPASESLGSPFDLRSFDPSIGCWSFFLIRSPCAPLGGGLLEPGDPERRTVRSQRTDKDYARSDLGVDDASGDWLSTDPEGDSEAARVPLHFRMRAASPNAAKGMRNGSAGLRKRGLP